MKAMKLKIIFLISQPNHILWVVKKESDQWLTECRSLEAIFSADEIYLSNLGIRLTNDHLCQVISKSAQKCLQRFFFMFCNCRNCVNKLSVIKHKRTVQIQSPI